MPRTIKFAEYVERRRADASVPIELPDGSTIVAPPADLWVDEVFTALTAGDQDAAMRAILGDDQCERFKAAGGNWRMFNQMWEEANGADVGEAPASPGS